jgi:hypothetical protein
VPARSLSSPTRSTVRCSTNTFPPSRTPTPRPSSGCSAWKPRWRRRRS